LVKVRDIGDVSRRVHDEKSEKHKDRTPLRSRHRTNLALNCLSCSLTITLHTTCWKSAYGCHLPCLQSKELLSALTRFPSLQGEQQGFKVQAPWLAWTNLFGLCRRNIMASAAKPQDTTLAWIKAKDGWIEWMILLRGMQGRNRLHVQNCTCMGTRGKTLFYTLCKYWKFKLSGLWE
jgi:hypothetical protein